MTQRATPTRRTLGTASLCFFVIAAAAPLTTMAALAPLAFMFGGAITPLGFIIAGLTYLLFATGFMALVRHRPQGGAFYAYISLGLGRDLGVGSALVAYLSYALGQIGFCAVAGLFTHQALLQIGAVDVPWGLCAAAMALSSGVLAYCRIELNAIVMATLIIAEIGILAVFSVVVLISGGAEGLRPESFDIRGLFAPGIGMLLVASFLVFIGFEQTALYSEEAKDPKRTVSRATFIAIGFLTLFYTLASWSIYVATGPSGLDAALTKDAENMVFNLATQYLGSKTSTLMLILVITSFFAGVLAFHGASSRYLMAIAEDGAIPTVFAKRNRFGMPGTACVFQTMLVTASVLLAYQLGLDPYRQVVVWTNTPTLIGVLALQIITSVAVMRYFHHNRIERSLWQTLFAPLLAVLILSSVLYLLVRDMTLFTGLEGGLKYLILSPLAVAFIVGSGCSYLNRKPATSNTSAV